MTEDKFLLYKQYVDVIEHIHILMGGVPINGYEYKSEYLKKNSYQWLSKMREQLAYLIWVADCNNEVMRATTVADHNNKEDL